MKEENKTQQKKRIQTQSFDREEKLSDFKRVQLDTETSQLLIDLKNGSEEAFQKIFYKWNRQIYAVLSKILRLPEDAEDITQDVFEKIWENRHQIDTDKEIGNYIFIVARNTAYSYLEKKKVRFDYLANLQYNEENPLTAEDALSAQEIENKAQAIIERMPELRGVIFRMNYLEDLDNSQISERLNISRERVAKELHLARKQMKSLLTLLLIITFSS